MHTETIPFSICPHPGHCFIVHEVLQKTHHRVSQEINGVWVTQDHGEVTQNLLLASSNTIQESLKFPGPG